MRHPLLTTITPVALTAALLSSCAMARQESAQGRTVESEQTFAYSSSDGDQQGVDLRVENGRVVKAKVDGKEIPPSQVRKVEGGFDVLAPNGEVLRHIPIVQGAGVERQRGIAAGGEPVMRKRVRVNPHGAVVPDGGERNVVVRIGEPIAPPKWMIGAGLGTPDESLTHHLKIDASKATLVTAAMKDLPAAKAGIEKFDVIVAINGDRNASPENLRRVLREAKDGEKIKLEIRRGGETNTVELTPVPFVGAALEVEGFELPQHGAFAFTVPGQEMEVEMEVDGDFDGEFDWNEQGGEGDGGNHARRLHEEMIRQLEAGDGNAMFFVGPDGKRREIRIPPMQQRDGRNMDGRGPDPSRARIEQLERALQQLHEQSGAQHSAQQSHGDERLRRLEERLDQLMRELEHDRAARKQKEI